MRIVDIVLNKGFVVTAEIAPPKGTDYEKAYNLAAGMAEFADAVNITEGQSATMRLGSMALSHLLGIKKIETIMQITCRDQNRIALQSTLLSASCLGIKNVLCLTGDHVLLGDHKESKQVFDLDSVSLLHAVNTLNNGYDLAGNSLSGRTNLCPGAVVNPSADPIEPQLVKMRRKIKAGARFFQTQPVFDLELLKPVLDVANESGVPVLMGLLYLRSAAMANRFNEKSGICVPDHILARMNESESPESTGLEIVAALTKEARGICRGVHVMGINRADLFKRVMVEAV